MSVVRVHLLGEADLGGPSKVSVANRVAALEKTLSLDELVTELAAPSGAAAAQAHHQLGPLANANLIPDVDKVDILVLLGTEQQTPHDKDTAALATILSRCIEHHYGAFGFDSKPVVEIGVLTDLGAHAAARATSSVIEAASGRAAHPVEAAHLVDKVQVVLAGGSVELFLGVTLGAWMTGLPIEIVPANRMDQDVSAFDLTSSMDGEREEVLRQWLEQTGAYRELAGLGGQDAARWSVLDRVQALDWHGARAELANYIDNPPVVLPEGAGVRPPQSKDEQEAYVDLFEEILGQSMATSLARRQLLVLQVWIDARCRHLSWDLSPNDDKEVLEALRTAAEAAGVPGAMQLWTSCREAEWTYLIPRIFMARAPNNPRPVIFDSAWNRLQVYEKFKEFLTPGLLSVTEATLLLRHGNTVGDSGLRKAATAVRSRLRRDVPPGFRNSGAQWVMPVGNPGADPVRCAQMAKTVAELASDGGYESADDGLALLLVPTASTSATATLITEELKNCQFAGTVDTQTLTAQPSVSDGIDLARRWFEYDSHLRSPEAGVVFLCNPGTKEQNLGVFCGLLAESARQLRRLRIVPLQNRNGSTVAGRVDVGDEDIVVRLLGDQVALIAIRAAVEASDPWLAGKIADRASSTVREIPVDFGGCEVALEKALGDLQQLLSTAGDPGAGTYARKVLTRLRFWEDIANEEPVRALAEATAALERGRVNNLYDWRGDGGAGQQLWELRNGAPFAHAAWKDLGGVDVKILIRDVRIRLAKSRGFPDHQDGDPLVQDAVHLWGAIKAALPQPS